VAAITIRKLPDEVKRRLRLRAAANGHSMEAEARGILVEALSAPSRTDSSWIEQLIVIGDELDGIDLEIFDDHPATAADLCLSDR
jgi:plasmid stability protein